MMHTHPTYSDLDHNSALVRAFRSLRVGEVKIIAQVVDAFGGAWSIKTHDNYDGYLFMLVEPSSAATDLPSYMVSGKIGQIELAALQGDACQTFGRFTDIYGVAAQLASCLVGATRDDA